MIPRRYSILFWATPVLLLQWIVLVAIDLEASGWYEYAAIGFFLGSVFGQTTLAAAWAALGPGPITWRILLSLVWVAMLPVVIAINLGIHAGQNDGALVVGVSQFGQWLLVQLPLWILAIGYGLRLRHVGDQEKTPNRGNSASAICWSSRRLRALFLALDEFWWFGLANHWALIANYCFSFSWRSPQSL